MHLVRLTEPGRRWLHGIWPLVVLLCACVFPCRETRADECSLAPHAGLQSVSVHTPSGDRPVAVYFPPNYVEARPLALVIDLHGSGGNGEEHAAVSGLRPLAERRHFIVASPDGGVSLPGQPGAYAWNVPGVPLVGDARLPADAPDDVAFLAGLIDTLTAAHCADAHHVYVTGFSGGARMASALACSLPERIAAIAPVAGLRAGRARPDDPAGKAGRGARFPWYR
jgi:polyhydroxybutyrate depolymerase